MDAPPADSNHAAVMAQLAAIIRGDAIDSRALLAVDTEAFVEAATHHGGLPLAVDRLEILDNIPPVLLARLRERATADAAADLVREVELRRLLERLDEAAAGALVIKGAHLAYSHYARPDLRPRLDTDLIVPLARKRAAHDVLIELGYEAAGQMSGDLVAYQAAYEKRQDALVVHGVDLHWKIANPQVFASALTYEELADTAVPLDRLSPAARGLSTVHALLLACTHRVAHHHDSDRLIWLYDIDLLARAMTANDWQRFVDLAADRKMVAVCRHSLEQATKWFLTDVPDHVWKDPRFQAAADERSAGYLRPRRHVSVIASDVRALPTWGARWRLLQEHFFPPAAYMRNVYAPASRSPLVFLYAYRLWRGARKWLARADAS